MTPPPAKSTLLPLPCLRATTSAALTLTGADASADAGIITSEGSSTPPSAVSQVEVNVMVARASSAAARRAVAESVVDAEHSWQTKWVVAPPTQLSLTQYSTKGSARGKKRQHIHAPAKLSCYSDSAVRDEIVNRQGGMLPALKTPPRFVGQCLVSISFGSPGHRSSSVRLTFAISPHIFA